MCPICWATALAAFASLSAASLLAAGLRDRWIVSVTIFLGIFWASQRWSAFELPWWSVYWMIALLLVRTILRVANACRGPIQCRGWKQACTLATKTCRKKSRN